MCNPKIKASHAVVPVAQIDGRPVLQPACNRVVLAPEPGRPLKKKSLQKSLSLPSSFETNTTNNNAAAKASPATHGLSPPLSPKPNPFNHANGLNSSTDNKPVGTNPAGKPAAVVRKKPKKSSEPVFTIDPAWLSSDRAPGTIAAEQREQAILMQAQRKMRIARYGRVASKLDPAATAADSPAGEVANQQEKRCSFITPNSDPVYVAYHDEEWGVPVHDEQMLFELLVLSGAQVGSDWTTILKRRNDFRAAFTGFDAEVVARYTERQAASVSSHYALDLGLVRAVVDNASRIIEVRRDLGSLDKYLWGFVSQKPLSPNYKLCRKIPVKTSKAECISKDMVRRGFRFVGPTVIHSFMQAAGLTNDHLISCPRHLRCSAPTNN